MFYDSATGEPTTLVVPIKRGILWDDASLRETCGPQRRQRAAFAFAFVSCQLSTFMLNFFYVITTMDAI